MLAQEAGRPNGTQFQGAADLIETTPGALSPLIEAAKGPGRFEETAKKMGTSVKITVVSDSPDQAREAIAAAFEEIDRLTAILSRHLRASSISQLNNSSRITGPEPEIIDTLRAAASIHALSAGAFDPTVLPYLTLIKESFMKTGTAPGIHEFREIRELVDFSAVRFDGNQIQLKSVEQQISLDGVAKGYIVDRAGEAIRSAGVSNALINAGGDILALGRSQTGRPWRVAVRNPFFPQRHLQVIHLSNQAVATSGSYEVFFDKKREYHHLIDPYGTGPASALVSATTLAKNATIADALSTAVFVKPELLKTVEGMVVSRDGRQFATSGFKRLI